MKQPDTTVPSEPVTEEVSAPPPTPSSHDDWRGKYGMALAVEALTTCPCCLGARTVLTGAHWYDANGYRGFVPDGKTKGVLGVFGNGRGTKRNKPPSHEGLNGLER